MREVFNNLFVSFSLITTKTKTCSHSFGFATATLGSALSPKLIFYTCSTSFFVVTESRSNSTKVTSATRLLTMAASPISSPTTFAKACKSFVSIWAPAKRFHPLFHGWVICSLPCLFSLVFSFVAHLALRKVNFFFADLLLDFSSDKRSAILLIPSCPSFFSSRSCRLVFSCSGC